MIGDQGKTRPNAMVKTGVRLLYVGEGALESITQAYKVSLANSLIVRLVSSAGILDGSQRVIVFYCPFFLYRLRSNVVVILNLSSMECPNVVSGHEATIIDWSFLKLLWCFCTRHGLTMGRLSTTLG